MLFRVLCCPDSFKGTATAREAAEAMASGVRDAGAEPVVAPMADGGEGTAELLADASPSATRHDVTVADAVGRPATAAWWNLGDGRAVLDLASASGLPAVADVKDARAASTRGTGELIRDCLDHGIRDLTVCLGGSATTDGGSGIVTALGGAVFDAEGNPLPPGGGPLADAAAIDTDGLDPRLAGVRWTLLLDVTTPPRDAPAVFGPQKGASADDVNHLTGALLTWCGLTGADPDAPGFGAAGATPVGVAAIAAAAGAPAPEIQRGAAVVAGAMGILDLLPESAPAGVGLVLTGEGSVDGQSDVGKVAGFLLDRAAGTDPATPVHLIGGRVDAQSPVVKRAAGATALDAPFAETLPALREAAHRATLGHRP